MSDHLAMEQQLSWLRTGLVAGVAFGAFFGIMHANPLAAPPVNEDGEAVIL